MANFASTLKAEILRLARKEVRQQTAALQRASAAHRRQLAALRRQVVALERKAGELSKRGARPLAAPAEAAADGAAPRFSAKGLKSLRARLELSASDLGRLLAVSGQSVYNWENGKAVPRRAQVQALAELRGLGKREARTRLEAAATPAAGTGGKAAKRASRPAKAKAKAKRKSAPHKAARKARRAAA